MEESVGKTYVSDRFCNMNSREFTVEPDGTFVEVPFVNYGLFLGLGRSESVITDLGAQGGERGLHDEGPLWQRALALLEQAPQSLRHRLYNSFLDYNSKVLKSVRLPWFLPTAYGGLGLPGLTLNGSIVNVQRDDLPSTFFQFDIGGDVVVKQIDDVFARYGQTPLYPTYENLRAARAMNQRFYRGGKSTGDQVILRRLVNDLSVPPVYRLHSVVNRGLPDPVVLLRTTDRIGNVPTNYLNFATFAMASASAPISELSNSEFSFSVINHDILIESSLSKSSHYVRNVIRENERAYRAAAVRAKIVGLPPFPVLKHSSLVHPFYSNGGL